MYWKYVRGSNAYLLCWGKPTVKQSCYMAAKIVNFQRAQLFDNMENDLFHVQWTTLGNKCCRDIIAMKRKRHQLYQLTDMVKVRGSNSKMMVTGSDDPVTHCTNLMPRPTVHIALQNKQINL